MPKKRYNAEEIIHKLREADAMLVDPKRAKEGIGPTDRINPRTTGPALRP